MTLLSKRTPIRFVWVYAIFFNSFNFFLLHYYSPIYFLDFEVDKSFFTEKRGVNRLYLERQLDRHLTNHHHYYHRFQNAMQRLASWNSSSSSSNSNATGLLTTQSGCRMAKWVYPSGHSLMKYRDCARYRSKRLLKDKIGQIQDNDTIYVVLTRLEEFVNGMLEQITVDVVIISGQIQLVPQIAESTIDKLLRHEHVIHWFCQNLATYGGNDSTRYHPKVSPFPYGLKEVVHRPTRELGEYINVLLKSQQGGGKIHKSTLIFAGPLARTPQTPTRDVNNNIPSMSTRMTPGDYFVQMAQAAYILSPNGDRPECYRHYEAIGLGTVPITELDPVLFRHLAHGPVIFQNSNWDLTSLQNILDPDPIVNRNLILEEYWMDYIDWTVSRSLHWWGDRH